jgi:hypothetical protein
MPASYSTQTNAVALIKRLTQNATQWLRHQRLSQKWSTYFPYVFDDVRLLVWPETWLYLGKHGDTQFFMYRDTTHKCDARMHDNIVNAINKALAMAPTGDKLTIQANAKQWINNNPRWKIDVEDQTAIDRENTLFMEIGGSLEGHRLSWLNHDTPFEDWRSRIKQALADTSNIRPFQNTIQNAKHELPPIQYAMLLLDTRIHIKQLPYSTAIHPKVIGCVAQEWNASPPKYQQHATLFSWFQWMENYERVSRARKERYYKGSIKASAIANSFYHDPSDDVDANDHHKKFVLLQCSVFAKELEEHANLLYNASSTSDLRSMLPTEHIGLINLDYLDVQEALGIPFLLNSRTYWNMYSAPSHVPSIDLGEALSTLPENTML